jgi:hypothetical protein
MEENLFFQFDEKENANLHGASNLSTLNYRYKTMGGGLKHENRGTRRIIQDNIVFTRRLN